MFCRYLVGMTGTESKTAVLKNAASKSKSETPRWPLRFRIPPGSEHQSQQGLAAFGVTSTKEKPRKKWWSYQLYRGPNGEQVKVQYSKTKAESEVLAKQFMGEKVVGFDMEWPWNDWKSDRLQNKIGLIQVATEEKIALFHIGLHAGKTTDDIIAPSLRKLIESPAIGKIGVGILSADFARLRRYFKLQPKGAVELSHLHRLVTFGGRKPELVSTKMTSLAHQVEQHLGHPLYKGDVRTSNWSKPLSQEQIKYAAGDAYAGIMLYHCLNYKRLQVDPVPPMPIHAEKYLGFKLAGVGSLYLEPAEEGGHIMTSAFFFGVPTAVEDLSRSKKTGKTSKTGRSSSKTKATTDALTVTKANVPRATETAASALDPASLALYQELLQWRIANSSRISDAILIRLAEQRPVAIEALLGIRGLGRVTQKSHGKEIVAVIIAFMTKNNMDLPEPVLAASATSTDTTDKSGRPSTPAHTQIRPSTPDSSPAFGRAPRTPQLHTGLSFTLSTTKLAEDSNVDSDSDSSLPSLDFGPSPSRRASGQKRKRADSPGKKAPSSASKLQDAIAAFRYKEVYCSPSISSSTRLVSPRASSSSKTPLTPRSKMLYNKLTALSRLVATKRKTSPESLVSAQTMETLARNPPRTDDELQGIPGMETFILACGDAGVDLLGRIRRFGGV